MLLTIEDDGPGFDPELVRTRGGLGVLSMQERARLVGAQIVFSSAPGHGTIIEVHLPWPAEEKGGKLDGLIGSEDKLTH